MWLQRLSGGSVGLIDLDKAKTHLRILSDETDGEVEDAIAAASAVLDMDQDGFGGLGFPLVAQQWQVKARRFLPDLLRLPFSHVTSVNAITYTDPDGAPGTVLAADYLLTQNGRRYRVELLSGKSWPAVADRPDAVSITFTAGFADVASVPEDIKRAALHLTTLFFHARGSATDEAFEKAVLECVDRLTRRYRPLVV